VKLSIVRADPAGNITIFVLDQIDDPALRLRAAGALLADPSLGAEQVGFVIPPDRPPPAGTGRWRLEMMGGEFCGNAARSFGLYAARETGLRGKQEIRIGISGVPDPVPVRVDLDASTAELEMPGPRAGAVLPWEGRSLPLYFFEGITHLIAEGLSPGRDLALGLIEAVRRTAPPPEVPRSPDGRRSADDRRPAGAWGVMFYDPARRFMRPAVYVAATDSLVFESSCGSGTAALAVYLSGGPPGGPAGGETRREWEISQPGGVIGVRAEIQAGKLTLGIGGPVKLGGSVPVEYRDFRPAARSFPGSPASGGSSSV
jgi:diaminopimelate epimerase